jgi:hypothetical protein
MDEDFDRLRAGDEMREPLTRPSREYKPDNRLAWIALFVLVTAVIGALWWWAPRTSESPAEAVGRVPAEGVIERPVPQVQGLGVGEPDPNLPPLGDLDAYVRRLLAAMSSRPELAALLASDGLVRRFAVSVDAIARGDSPAGQVRAVAPRGPFQVQQRGSEMTVDPASYARYEGLVKLVDALPTPQLARLYGRLKPRLEEAYAELGSGGTFDDAMTRAIRHLLATPLPPSNALLQPSGGINYAYTDERFEGLSAAQRQLLRLGPDRARRVQERLRAFGIALGIPPEQLPSRP